MGIRDLVILGFWDFGIWGFGEIPWGPRATGNPLDTGLSMGPCMDFLGPQLKLGPKGIPGAQAQFKDRPSPKAKP